MLRRSRPDRQAESVSASAGSVCQNLLRIFANIDHSISNSRTTKQSSNKIVALTNPDGMTGGGATTSGGKGVHPAISTADEQFPLSYRGGGICVEIIQHSAP